MRGERGGSGRRARTRARDLAGPAGPGGGDVSDGPLSRPIDRLVIHHSASPTSTTLEQIDRWHRDRGFDGIGYHHLIRADGRVLPGRDLSRPGAHAAGHNAHSIAICVAGDNTRPEHAWTAAQKQALVVYVRWFRIFFPSAAVVGHRDLPGAATTCPGVDVRELLREPGATGE